MCKRNSPDPLVRAFLDRYYLNLLSVPREHVSCGDLYVEDTRGVSAPGHLSHLLEPPFAMPAPITGEAVADLVGIISQRVTVNVGLGLLETFLTALGASAIIDEVKAGYEAKRLRRIRFRFRGATRDHIDPLQLGTAFIGRRLIQDHPFVAPGNKYYVVAGVVYTPSLCILAEDERSTAIDIDLEALKIASAKTGLVLERSAAGEVTYTGPKRLAIGVELYEMFYDDTTQRLHLKLPEQAVRVRPGQRQLPLVAPAFIGGAEADIFVHVV